MTGRFERIAGTLYWEDPEGVFVPCTGPHAAMSPDDWCEALDAAWPEPEAIHDRDEAHAAEQGHPAGTGLPAGV